LQPHIIKLADTNRAAAATAYPFLIELSPLEYFEIRRRSSRTE
jgi:hypothetical protein